MSMDDNTKLWKKIYIFWSKIFHLNLKYIYIGGGGGEDKKENRIDID